MKVLTRQLRLNLFVALKSLVMASKNVYTYGLGITPSKLFYLKGLPGYLQLYARYQKPINKDKKIDLDMSMYGRKKKL